MLIRRLLLILLFLLAQAGALAHGIGHGLASGQSQDEGLDPDVACALCLAFAPLGAGLASTHSASVPLPAHLPLPSAGFPALPDRYPPAYCSRDPPRLNA